MVNPEAPSGSQAIFLDELIRLADDTGNRQVRSIAARAAAPVRVGVSGRTGVGARTVARALAAAGVTVVADPDTADIDVRVIAEVLKPEDRAALLRVRPTLIVLNKADLAGFGPGGPLAAAQRQADRCRALTGMPTVATMALLAVAELDDELLEALHTLSDHPLDMGSTDVFVQAEHAVSARVRVRLLAAIDRVGIAHAILAIRRHPPGGATPVLDGAAIEAVLREASRIGPALDQLDRLGDEIRYRRERAAAAALEALAAMTDDARVAAFLACDQTVIARMVGAVAVVEAAGLRVDPAAPAAGLGAVARWQHYSRGPVNGVHRAAGADIVCGSLRLLGQAQHRAGG